MLKSIRIIANKIIPANNFLINKFEETRARRTPKNDPIIAPIPIGIAAARTIKPSVPAGVTELALWNK